MAAACKKKTELSPVMMACIKHAHDHGGGFLVRTPGGFWVSEVDKNKVPHCVFYGSKSIQAIVDRGAGRYVESIAGRYGPFPVKIMMGEIDALSKAD